MPLRALVVAVAMLLFAASPAFALSKTETKTVGQVTASLSYDYQQTRYGTANFTNVRVTVDRAGQRLVDQTLGQECEGCVGWPAGGAQSDSITLRDLDADGEPEVLVDLYTGGAHCCFYTDTWRFDLTSGKYIFALLNPSISFPYVLKDLNHDGIPEFKTIDYRFSYEFGSYVDTPPPLAIYDWNAGNLVNVTHSYPKLAARDAATYYRVYLTLRRNKDDNLRGVLAAYLADSHNAGQGRVAWRRVVAAYRRGELDKRGNFDVGPFGKRYLTSLRRFLKKLGYLHS